MSDRQSKNFDEATRKFFSCVAGRTRSKRDDYSDTIAETRGISSSARRNVEATEASHDSCGFSAPIARIKQRTMVGKWRGYSSSCNDVEISGLEEVRAAHDCMTQKKRKKERNQLKPTGSVGCKKNGNMYADMDSKDIEVINEAVFRRKKTFSASKIEHSARPESSEGFSAASWWKNVDVVRKKPSATLDLSPEGVSHGFDQGLLVQKGNGNKDMDSEGIWIVKIEEAEFKNLKTYLTSKVGSSSKEEMNEGYSAVTPRKDLTNVTKKVSSADYRESFYSEDACNGSNHEWPHESSSFVQRGSSREDMVPEVIEIEKIDETEFRNQKTHSESKISRSVGQGLCGASSRKNVDGASKHISSAHHSKSFSHHSSVHYCTGSDVLVVDSSPLAKKGNKDELTSWRKLKINPIEEVGFTNGKSRIASKMGSSIRQGSSAANSRKDADIVKELPFHNCCGPFTFEGRSRGSDKGQTDNSSSFTGKGNNDEDTDSEEFGIEKIDESEFRNQRARFVRNVGSSTWQEPDGVHFASTSRKTVKSGSKKKSSYGRSDKNKKKRENFSNSTGKIEDESWNKYLHNDLNDSSVECISSYPSNKSSSGNISTFMPEDEISSYGAKHEVNLGVASRTRSKIGRIKKPAEVGKILSGSSVDSDSLSFEVESSDSVDGIEELSSYVEACDVRINIPMKVSAKRSEDCSKQEGSAVKHAPNRRHLNLQKEESNCDQLTFRKREFYSRKRQLSNEAPSKQTKRGKAHKTCGVHEENEEINRTFDDDANAEGDLKERGAFPKATCSKQSYAHNNSDEAKGANGLHPKDQSQGIMRDRKEFSPFHSRDDYNYSDGEDGNDDIHEIIETTSLDFHGHGKIAIAHLTDEIKEPTRRQQECSKHNDFCSRLADAVLGRGLVHETKGSDVEATLAPPYQTQNTLPLKFRFEDEVPKEVEKTEHEKEMEGLFADLDINWALEELGSLKYPEVDEENENPLAEESHHERCSKGKHELVLQDDQGLVCIYCHHVELGPKDILPEWVEKAYQDTGRKKYFEAEELDFDELHLQSINNFADFGNSANGTVWSIKPGIRESMYEHQREGFEFLWKNLAGSINLEELKSTDPSGVGGCIISHAPGTGKTRLTINFVETYLKMFPDCMPVIISPASMLLTWEEEFRKWNVGFPFLNLNNPDFLGQENKAALRLLSGVKRRNPNVIRMVKICTWSMGRSILGISYSLFEKLTGEKYVKGKTSNKKKTLDDQKQKMRKILLEKPGLVVLDEGHTPRNQRSNIWNALLKLQTEKRVILSGTPFQNNFAELFNTLRLVRPTIAGVLAQERTFAEMVASRRMSKSRKYKGEHSQFPLISEVIDRAVDKLKIAMVPFVHVHKGTILQQSLPGLRDCVVLLKPSALQKTLIERLEGSPSTFEFEHRVALISVHPYLFVHSDLTEEQRIGIDMASLEASKLNPNEGVKTKFILELVRISKVMNEKVLIFSQYIQPLELIKEHLKENFKWVDGKEILQMEGKLEQKQRQVLINAFNDPKSESKIMLASTRCCSEGISLIGASRVVLLDVVWNPSVERQAISRAYRIGQKKCVYTYHLMTSGTTEADKYCRQAEKERLSELVFTSSSNESNNQKHHSLGIEDRILEEMVGHENLKEMFKKIINQPKDTDLIQTFGLTT